MRTHDRNSFPGQCCREDQLALYAYPVSAIRTGRVAYRGGSRTLTLPGLPGIPEMVAIPHFDNRWTVDIHLPGFRGKHNFWRAPEYSILAFTQGDTALGAPGKPHPIRTLLLQHSKIKTGSQVSSQDRIVRPFLPSSRSLLLHSHREPPLLFACLTSFLFANCSCHNAMHKTFLIGQKKDQDGQGCQHAASHDCPPNGQETHHRITQIR